MDALNYNEIIIDTQKAEEILHQIYGVKGIASSLPGEYDMNFKICEEGLDSYVLKISRPGVDITELEFQQSLLQHLYQQDLDILAPKPVATKDLKFVSSFVDDFGRERYVRLLSWISGRMYKEINPQRPGLRMSLGRNCGNLTRALESFDHIKARRKFEWDIAQSAWTESHLAVFNTEEAEIITYFQNRFQKIQPGYQKLRCSVVHNDANDHNVIVSGNLKEPEVLAAIDFGDAVYTQSINDLAITCAYGIMNQNDVLAAALDIVKGYHQSWPILEEELAYLYDCIAIRLVISVTKSAINKQNEPDNKYLQVSDKMAWDVLRKWSILSADFVHYSCRKACGYHAHPDENKFMDWARTSPLDLNSLFPTRHANGCFDLDLSVASTWLGHLNEFADFDLFEFKIKELQKDQPDKIIAGGYLEPRMVYTTAAYQRMGNERAESRTMHLGIDFWLPPKTPVYSMLKGEVVLATNDKGDKEYGGLIILKHQEKDLVFYSLYGHLSVRSALARKVGEPIEPGDIIGYIGDYPENGNWPPHLHFQLMLSMLGFTSDFPGVAYQSELEVWKSICPDPNLIFKDKNLTNRRYIDNRDLLTFRRSHLGKGMSLSYHSPLQMVRGMGSYLVDQFGATYLDTVNNVAHVGHEHFKVVKAGKQQMALLNTNTRYLHKNINLAAEELLSTFPPELEVVHFVNSGSEANELALRMAKVVTGHKDILASQMGYHGNTNACVEISSYKFEGEGGFACPEHTHIFPLPDSFRGKYRGSQTGAAYADEVKDLIAELQNQGKCPAALIVEPIISCGGQIELPEGFLSLAYEYTRMAGGLCISDEVQVGCGRIGSSFWGFQEHDVIPDIVTIGKPVGNGHPVAAVVCTSKVADAFANGMEYFNTFGGNPVSCAIMYEVLKVVKEERLQENALEVGNFLKTKLKALSKKFPILSDIRGKGLFLGIELTDQALHPLPEKTAYLANRMRDLGILMSVDGADHNVLKIKPPLVFSIANAEQLLMGLEKILEEDYMQLKF